MSKLKMHTPDGTKNNIARIAELIPTCITETQDDKGNVTWAIDFEQLRQELTDHIVDGPRERYHLDWPGKREALLAANAPIARTLRPCREESIDFDATRNLFIQGDNLDALKLLQEPYLNNVTLVYIDPPYNTQGDLLYEDDFAADAATYFSRSQQRDPEGNRLVANTESNGRFHSDWLSMLYPRLRLARSLLCDDGCIVIHMDENELANTIKLVEETFGEDNVLGVISWDKRNPKGDSTRVASQHESLVCACRNYQVFKERRTLQRSKANASTMLRKAKDLFAKLGATSTASDIEEANAKYHLGLNLSKFSKKYTLADINADFRLWLSKQDVSGGEAAYKYIDKDGRVYRTVSMAWPNKKKAPDDYFIPLKHPITKKNCPVPDRGWRNPPATMKALQDAGLIVFGEDESKQPERKYFLDENLSERLPSVIPYGGSDDELMKELGVAFDNPKPVAFAKSLIQCFAPEKDSLVVDFFAGSGTAAHAVMAVNAEDGGTRRFILVQLQEPCAEDSAAFRLGFKTICDVAKARILNAGKMLRRDAGLYHDTLDTGFRTLFVDSSNVRDVYYQPDAVTQEMLHGLVDNVKDDRKDEDLLFQVLLDWGVDLTLPIKPEKISGKAVYFVDTNALAACFEAGITEAFIKELAKRKPLRAVFRDTGYGSDATKINVEQIFKLLSPGTEVKSI